MLKRHRYYSPGYDAPSSELLLGGLPALFGAGALAYGLGWPYSVGYRPAAKRSSSHPFPDSYNFSLFDQPPAGSVRVHERDFVLGSRKFKRATTRRYKVGLKRRKFIRASKKLFF